MNQSKADFSLKKFFLRWTFLFIALLCGSQVSFAATTQIEIGNTYNVKYDMFGSTYSEFSYTPTSDCTLVLTFNYNQFYLSGTPSSWVYSDSGYSSAITPSYTTHNKDYDNPVVAKYQLTAGNTCYIKLYSSSASGVTVTFTLEAGSGETPGGGGDGPQEPTITDGGLFDLTVYPAGSSDEDSPTVLPSFTTFTVSIDGFNLEEYGESSYSPYLKIYNTTADRWVNTNATFAISNGNIVVTVPAEYATTPGTYELYVPASSYKYVNSTENKYYTNKALTRYYKIEEPQSTNFDLSLYPANTATTVSSLQSFTIAGEVNITGTNSNCYDSIEILKDGDPTSYWVTHPISGGHVTINISSEITEPGTYSIVVPARYFVNENGSVKNYSNAATFTFTVESTSAPTKPEKGGTFDFVVSPAGGPQTNPTTLDSFSTITLSVEGFDIESNGFSGPTYDPYLKFYNPTTESWVNTNATFAISNGKVIVTVPSQYANTAGLYRLYVLSNYYKYVNIAENKYYLNKTLSQYYQIAESTPAEPEYDGTFELTAAPATGTVDEINGITLQYGANVITKNVDCNQAITFNGSNVADADVTINALGVVTINVSATAAGTYNLVVPDDYFRYDDTANNKYYLSESKTLTYTIQAATPSVSLQFALPDGSEVNELASIKLSNTETVAQNSYTDTAYVLKNGVRDTSISTVWNAYNKEYTFKINNVISTITDPGTYTLVIPAGALKIAGEPYDVETRVSYIISEEATVEYFDIYSAIPLNNAIVSSLSYINISGDKKVTEIASNKSVSLTCNGTAVSADVQCSIDSSDGTININIYPALSAGGTYILTIPEGLFKNVVDEATSINSAAEFTYTIPEPITTVPANGSVVTSLSRVEFHTDYTLANSSTSSMRLYYTPEGGTEEQIAWTPLSNVCTNTLPNNAGYYYVFEEQTAPGSYRINFPAYVFSKSGAGYITAVTNFYFTIKELDHGSNFNLTSTPADGATPWSVQNFTLSAEGKNILVNNNKADDCLISVTYRQNLTDTPSALESAISYAGGTATVALLSEATTPGYYQISVPEGFFRHNGETEYNLNNAYTATVHIPEPTQLADFTLTATPEAGTVDEVAGITLQYTGHVIAKNSANTAAITFKGADVDESNVTIADGVVTVNVSATAGGDYTLAVPAGYFIFDDIAANHQYAYNAAFSATYRITTLTEGAAIVLSATPAAGDVDGITSFSISGDMALVDAQSDSSITLTYRASAEDTESTEIALGDVTIADGVATVAPTRGYYNVGVYTLSIPAGYFKHINDAAYTIHHNAATEFEYTITTPAAPAVGTAFAVAVTPAEGKVSKIQNFRVSADVALADAESADAITLTYRADADAVESTDIALGSVTFADGVATFAAAAQDTPGVYTLTIPARYFKNYVEETHTVCYNDAATVTYTIKESIACPLTFILAAGSTVGALNSSIDILDTDVSFADNKTAKLIEYNHTDINGVETTTKTYLCIYPATKYIQIASALTEAGDYTFIFPAGMIRLNGNIINEETTVTYHVDPSLHANIQFTLESGQTFESMPNIGVRLNRPIDNYQSSSNTKAARIYKVVDTQKTLLFSTWTSDDCETLYYEPVYDTDNNKIGVDYNIGNASLADGHYILEVSRSGFNINFFPTESGTIEFNFTINSPETIEIETNLDWFGAGAEFKELDFICLGFTGITNESVQFNHDPENVRAITVYKDSDRENILISVTTQMMYENGEKYWDPNRQMYRIFGEEQDGTMKKFTDNGDYTMHIPARFFKFKSGYTRAIGDGTQYNKESNIHFTINENSDVTTGVENIVAGDAEANPTPVYNLQGVQVLPAATPDQLSRLARGIYIINGKKHLIK